MVGVADRSTHENMRVADHPAPSRLCSGPVTQSGELRLGQAIGILAIDINHFATLPVKLLAHVRFAATAPKRFVLEKL